MRRLLNLLGFRRRRLERDLGRELQYHLDRRVDDLKRSGLGDNEARRRAAVELGGIAQVQEEVRDVWLTRWLRDFGSDVLFSTRSFLRRPSFTAAAVLSLALGIGATTAIYSLVDQLVLHALPVREPERLVLIDWKGYPATVNAFGSSNLMSYPLCRDLHMQERFFEGVLCRAATTINLSTGGEHRPAAAEIVSGTYFSVLGVRPAVGRFLTPDDDRTPGPSPVVVISYELWQTQMGAVPDVQGRTILVNKQPMTIVGVAAPGFHGVDVGQVPALWIPASMSAQAIPGFDNMLNRRVRWMQVLGRLRPNVTLAEAQSGLQPWFQIVLQEDMRQPGFPTLSADRRQRFLASTLVLTPAPQGHSPLRRQLSQPLWVLLAATTVLLGLACLNVAGLFLARGSARAREISTRVALGASRGRIGRQLLADSVAIALAGGAVGVALAPFAMTALIASLPRDVAATALHASVDRRMLLFTIAISVAAGLLTGVVPAWQVGRRALMTSLRERTGVGSSGLRSRRVMVTAQMALTLILVIGAALFVRTLTTLIEKGPGFDTSSLISFGIDPLRNGSSQADAGRLIRRVYDDIRASNTTRGAAVSMVPLLGGGSWNNPMTIQAPERLTTDREVHLNNVSAGFFATLGARIIAGRDFDERESMPAGGQTARVAIVNEAFVKRYLGGRNPIGMHIGPGTGPTAKPEYEVIGVVANISYRGVREDWEQAYFPVIGPEAGSFYVRASGSVEATTQSIRTIVRNADPTLPVGYFRTLDEQVNRSLSTERLLAALSTSFGLLALLLALVGVYGVMSFSVAQRRREIGIRLALGASRLEAVWLVLRDALIMIAAGIALAVPSLWMLGRMIEAQLYQVKPTDPATIAAAIVILCIAGVGSALIPARRASVIDPTETLRCE
jgi:predicted permease